MNASEEYVVNTICNSHCGGTCEIKAHVREGRIVRLECGDDKPGVRHRACAKGRAYRQRVYAPDRLLYPLKRAGARGSGEFARISWDEALDTVARELMRVRDIYGNASILHFCSMCDPHIVHHTQAFHRLLCQFGGYTAPWGNISDEGLSFASGTTYGKWEELIGGLDFTKYRLIIMWSWNPVATNQGSRAIPTLLRAKENGSKFIAVDPMYSDSAATYDARWIPIRPSTDTAALIAMAYVIVTEGFHDQDYIDRYTTGFAAFRDYLLGKVDSQPKTPTWAEGITGVPADTIDGLAREYAHTKPAIIAANIAAGRTAFGEQFHRAVFALEAITGKTSLVGADERAREKARARGRVKLIERLSNPVEAGKPPRWNALPYRSASVNSSARVNVCSFADAIVEGTAGGYPSEYKALWLSNTNYLNQLGDLNRTLRAFDKLEFILVTEQFMTATAKLADIVLPVCTYFERNDLCAPGFGNTLENAYGLVAKAIEPLGESKSQLQICQELAPRLGILDYGDMTDEEWVRSFVEKLCEIKDFPDYDALRRDGVYVLKDDVAVAEVTAANVFPCDQPYATPSGKIEIYSQIIADMDHPEIPPIPKHIDAWETPSDDLAKKYPLQLITPHYKFRAHSQFANIPWLRALENQAVTISSADAGRRGIRDGDMVRVFNDRGAIMIPCRVTERIMPGVVCIPQGAWYAPDKDGIDRGGCPNVLLNHKTSPAGAFVSNTALVEVDACH